MAKFKNIHSVSGKISFGESRIEFSGALETEDKVLIKQLSSNSNWVKVEDKESDNKDASKEALKELKAEAKELGVKFQNNISLDKLQEKVDEFKATLEDDSDVEAEDEADKADSEDDTDESNDDLEDL